MEKIITICGPTGVGKTGFAIEIARHVNGEIIGADSMQIYRYMDIGTAKPDAREREQVPHHLVDFLDPDAPFDAGTYSRLAGRTISKLVQRGKLPVVAGGTGLYIRALHHGLFRSDAVCEKTLSRLQQILSEKGSGYLHGCLARQDPRAAGNIHPHDAFRILRALEYHERTGRPISGEHQELFQRPLQYDTLTIGLQMDRKRLYERIDARVDAMLASGFMAEVAGLVSRGYSFDLKSMQAIGYRHAGMFLSGAVAYAEMVRLFKRDTRRYAKRQFTWFQKEPDIIWLDPSRTDAAMIHIKEFLTPG